MRFPPAAPTVSHAAPARRLAPLVLGWGRLLCPLITATACTAAPHFQAAPPALSVAHAASAAFRLYTPPDSAARPFPLVVMLHGCGQDAAEFEAVSGMDEVARGAGFAVLYPEQPVTAHHSRCWRWFDPDQQRRDRGEPARISGMVETVAATQPIDRGRVYVAGLSAGAAMAGIVAAAYPDTFAAAGLASGLEVRAADSELAGWTAMALGGPAPSELAPEIVRAMGERRRVMPVMVFHGGEDVVVRPINADQTVAQWVAIDAALLREGGERLPAEPAEVRRGQAPGGLAFERAAYRDSRGTEQVASYRVPRMGHAWPGGAAGHAFSEPRGPAASKLLWEFFRERRR